MGNDDILGIDEYCEAGDNLRFKVLRESTGEYFQVLESLPKWNDNGIFNLSRLTAREMPSETLISSAYPNPFNPSTNITFGIDQDSHVKAVIYDVKGREIAVLTNENYLSGYHNLIWNADRQSSGLYFLTIHSNGITEIQKLMLLK